MTLNSFNAMRYVGPFRTEVTEKINQLSEVLDTIEQWLKVQLLWENLVVVFTTGDIAKAMPLEAKVFREVDKAWAKIMENANERKNVVICCQNDILKTSLPGNKDKLEQCQKQLESYLEGKRAKFPRFYFTSPEDLLKILSQGSDIANVQDDFEKLFDAINRVNTAEFNRKEISGICQ